MSEYPSVQLRDARGPYDDLASIPAQSWAWEFVRRSDRIRTAWAALKPAWEEAESDGIRIVRADSADASELAPLLWASSLDQGAFDATVTWDPQASGRVLHAVSVPLRFGYGGVVLDLDQLEVQKTIVTVHGEQQLTFRDGAHSLQIAISGARIPDTVALFLDTGEDLSASQLRMLACLRTLRQTGSLEARFFPPHPRARRLMAVLKALDGYRAGRSHREIALELFGEERVARDWGDPGEHMRDAVRRAIVSGIALMERGYRSLLR